MRKLKRWPAEVLNDIAYNVIKVLNFGSGIHKSLKSLHQLLSKKTFTQLTLCIGLPFMSLYGKMSSQIVPFSYCLTESILFLNGTELLESVWKCLFMTSKAKFELP